MQLIWTERALAQFDRILDSIAWECGFAVTEKWQDKIDAALAIVPEHPFIGSEVREFRREDIREVGVPPYRVIYRVSRDTCHILAVLHCRQSLSADEF